MAEVLRRSFERKESKLTGCSLESTIISHVMPYPQNVQTAKVVEEIIRKNGAVPATIAIINGKMKIGLSEEALGFLAQSKKVEKASRRDLPKA